jgi:integrase
LGGLFAGELFVLAARPGVGKTSLACQFAHHAAHRGPVYFSSLEMSAAELATRIACGIGWVSNHAVRTGRVSNDDCHELARAVNEFGATQLWIHDRASLTAPDIRRAARRLAKNGLRLVVVDYLQRVCPTDWRLPRHEQVAEISDALKGLARELNVPVLCLAQLNREIDKTPGGPKLCHLKDSGSIEQDADVVAFLIRETEGSADTENTAAELRHLRAVLRVANEWGYLPKMPRIRMVKEPQKLVRYVTPEHFAAIYAACDAAQRPQSKVYSAADWWRAFLVYLYMTGCRVNEPLALRWDDVSLDKATAVTWHEDNKGKRDEVVPLHPVVVEHLRKLVDFGPMVFPWPHHERTLYVEFARIQRAAKDEKGERIVDLLCREKHEHTDSCHLYGFHDFRRAFATQNALRLTENALQALMRHKSYLTTKRYINMARQLDGAVEQLHVPEFLKTG